jgi:hypothetical protein
MSARSLARGAAAPIAAATLLAVVPAGAAAATHRADVPGSDVGSDPSRRVASLSTVYDDAGTLSGTITLGGDAATGTPARVVLHLGTESGDSCGPPQAVISAPLAGAGPARVLTSTGSEGDAQVGIEGPRVTLTATQPWLAGLSYRCTFARVASPDDASTTLGQTRGFRVLATDPPPPPAPPPPAPPTPAPAKVAKLAVEVGATPRTVRRNRWMSIRVRVRNVGTATARAVRLRIGGARGATVRLRRSRWSSIAAGRSASATVRVRLGARSRATTTLAVRASSGPLVAREAISLSRGRAATSGLVGRQFYGFVSHVDRAWDNRGVFFSNARWAYLGLPTGGLPTCTKATETLNDKGKPTGDGCRPYAYDRRTGRLKVGDQSGTFKNGTIVLDGVAMRPVDTPKAGTRLDVRLEHRGFSGLCGLVLGCTTWHETLAMGPNGQFVRTSSSISTLGGVGTPFVYGAQFPPDEHGTYEIQSRGRAVLRYADGTVKTHTIGIMRDKRGRPAPATEGVLLDDTNFYD